MNTCPSSAAGDFDPPQIPLSCSACPACARNLCQAVARAIGSLPDDPSIEVPQSVHCQRPPSHSLGPGLS